MTRHRTAAAIGLAGALATIVHSAGAAAAEPEKAAPSPFVQCDGFTGHVGTMALIGQIVAITATAGLAGDMMNKDNGNLEKRQDGKVGVAACDTALAQEADVVRRTQLGLARTVHYIEADDLPGALESVRAVPGLAPAMANDWGFQYGLGASTLYLESFVLARMGRTEEAEDVAMRSVALAPYDLFGMARTSPMAQLTPRMTAAKRDYLDHLVKIAPGYLALRADQEAWSGDYRAAAASKADQRTMYYAFLKPGVGDAPILKAEEALFRLMAGDKPGADAAAAQARQDLEALLAKGGLQTAGNQVNDTEQALAFFAIAEMAMAGDAAKARPAYSARERWLGVPQSVVIDIHGRLQAGLAPADRVGPLAKSPADLRKAFFDANVAALRQPQEVEKLYRRVSFLTKSGDFTRLSGATWKVGDKPRFLVRKLPKDLQGYELIDTSVMNPGIAGGEALILHAALIAQSRGKNGFILPYGRKNANGSLVRFGTIGEPGFPASATFPTELTITALSNHIPAPAPR